MDQLRRPKARSNSRSARTITEADVSVVGEAIALPTPGEVNSHAERQALIAQGFCYATGQAPRSDGVHIDGAYRIMREGEESELTCRCKGGWSSYGCSGSVGMWESVPAAALPPVLFGPLDNPAGRDRRSDFLDQMIDDCN